MKVHTLSKHVYFYEVMLFLNVIIYSLCSIFSIVAEILPSSADDKVSVGFALDSLSFGLA